MLSSTKTLATWPLWRTVALRSTPLAIDALIGLRRPTVTLAPESAPGRNFSAHTWSKAAKRFESSVELSLGPSQSLHDQPILHHSSTQTKSLTSPKIPDYLVDEYWWAYVHPNCIRALDHKFLVNVVLWGNFEMLRDAAIQELCDSSKDLLVHGKTLQMACVYANLTESLLERMAPSSCLDVIDVVPAQLENLERKLLRHEASLLNRNVTLSCRDAQDLFGFGDESFDHVLLFLLLHEMPNAVRRNALKEAGRVVKTGGKIVVVDYHQPSSLFWQTVMLGMYKLYEPFASDMWHHEIQDWLPSELQNSRVSKELYFGGLYQKVTITKQ